MQAIGPPSSHLGPGQNLRSQVVGRTSRKRSIQEIEQVRVLIAATGVSEVVGDLGASDDVTSRAIGGDGHLERLVPGIAGVVVQTAHGYKMGHSALGKRKRSGDKITIVPVDMSIRNGNLHRAVRRPGSA